MFSRLATLCSSSAETEVKMEKADPKPYKGWPNDIGFNAEEEQREPVELPVTGQIPSYAAGTLFRTGPAYHKVKDTVNGDFACSHWFDGFVHVYRFAMTPTAEGSCKVMYSSKRGVDNLVDNVRKTGRLDGISFAQKRDPCDSFFKKLKTAFDPFAAPSESVAANIGVTITPNVPGLGGIPSDGSKPRNLIAFTDASAIQKLDPDTLEPVGVTNQKSLHPDLIGPLSSAHAQFDPVTGDCYNYNLELDRIPVYRIFHSCVSTGKTEILATIKGTKPAYIHSFFLTKSYVILAVFPSYFAKMGISILWERNILDAIAPFDTSSKTKWFVIDRVNGRGHIATFENEAFFAFHTANAWEEENADGTSDIFANIVQYPNMDVLHKFYYENLISTGSGVEKYRGNGARTSKGRLVRYKLASIDPKKASPKTIRQVEKAMEFEGAVDGELPTINPRFATQKNRYIYGICDRGESSFVDGLVKMDMDTQTSVIWSKKHHTPGEVIFVPDPEKTGEEDGVLLSVVLDGDTGLSYLLCLDAKTFTEIGRADVPTTVAMGLHGSHFPYKL